MDIDIWPTPFTNTFPIRRAPLAVGERREFVMAWVSAPELTVRPMRQGYTRLADRLYLFENLDGTGFRAELPVDEDDVVLDYQGVFRRSTDGARREPGSGEDWQRVGLHIDGLVDAFLAQALGLVQDGDAALAESGRCAKGPRLTMAFMSSTLLSMHSSAG